MNEAGAAAIFCSVFSSPASLSSSALAMSVPVLWELAVSASAFKDGSGTAPIVAVPDVSLADFKAMLWFGASVVASPGV